MIAVGVTEKHVEIAHKLYEMRRTVQRLWPVEWREKLAPWIDFVRRFSEHEGINFCSSPLRLWNF